MAAVRAKGAQLGEQKAADVRQKAGGGLKMKILNRIETVKDRTERANLSSLGDEIRNHILREFARRGKAPALEQTLEALKTSLSKVNEAVEKLENADILLADDEIISVYSFSALNTSYRVVFEDGRSVHALCATDALGVHFMLDEGITVLSECPYCGRELKIELKDGKIAFCKPDIKYVAITKRCGCSADTLCPFINFFCSVEHSDKWKKDILNTATARFTHLERQSIMPELYLEIF